MTRAQYDAELISECIANLDIDSVADIICCRSMFQLQQIHDAYEQKCKLDVKKQLQALAQKDKKKTTVKIIGGILNLNRQENIIDMNNVNSDLNFVLTNKSFQGEAKERLVLIFTANSVQYIKLFNDQFKLKSKDPLTTFIDNKLGTESTARHYCKTRILYALDTSDYYAGKIKNLSKQYKENKKKIQDIFIQRMELDLEFIKNVWVNKEYGDGEDLKTWITNKSTGRKAGCFLSKMLDNCSRHAVQDNTINNQNEAENDENKQKDDTINNQNEAENDENKQKQTEQKAHQQMIKILEDNNLRKRSVELVTSDNNEFIKFLKKILKSKLKEKIWSKCDPNNTGKIGAEKF
eukprot:145724_1